MRVSLQQSFPILGLAYYRLRYQHFKRKEDLDHHLEGLRKAGVGSWPSDFQEPTEGRLSGDDMEALAVGKVWKGVLHNGVPFVQQNTETGTFAYSSATSLRTGTFWINGDQLCLRVPGYMLGRAACGYVYRNSDEGKWSEYDYINLAPDSVRYFSVSN